MWHQRPTEIGVQPLKIPPWLKRELETGTEVDRQGNLEYYAFC